MKGFPKREIINELRESYPPGTRVRLVQMNDPFNTTLMPGDEGTVRAVDDIQFVTVKH